MERGKQDLRHDRQSPHRAGPGAGPGPGPEGEGRRLCHRRDPVFSPVPRRRHGKSHRRCHRHPRCEPRLREQCFGKYEGTPRNGEKFRISKTCFADRYDGGESMLQLAQRIYNLLDELRDQPDKTYLLVAHNGIARVVESYFHDMTNEEYALAGIRNCELVEYHFD